MARSSVSLDALDAWRRSQYTATDVLRRAQADIAGTFGLGPSEHPYQVIASGAHWRLRDYGGDAAMPALVIVAAPIKRPYIWDLTPAVSAIGYCLQQNLQVYLVEWMPASSRTGNSGLDDYTKAISKCLAKISKSAGKPFLIGHSLGGTLAAIYGAFAPESLSGAVLLGAPLCFEPATSPFRDALVSLVPSDVADAEPFPGSLLSYMSALASPSAFVWSRLMDAALSAADRHALDIHARVERWALDEVPLPGKLVRQLIVWLYKENRFCRETLSIAARRVGPSRLSVPTLAVVNTTDAVAPLSSIKPFVDAMPAKNGRIIEFPGELGVCLQHLAILVGREARARVWPEIISWLKMQA